MKLLVSITYLFLSIALIIHPTTVYSQSFGLDLMSLKKKYVLEESCNGLENGDADGITCKLVFYDDEGLIAYEGLSVNGLPEGVWKTYRSGRLYSELEHKQGQIDGSYKIYSSEGNLFQELTFKDGIPHGSLATYSLFPPYQIREALKVKDGLLHGKALGYSGGEIVIELNFIKGKLHGNLKMFGNNETLEGSVSYKEGKLNSNLIYYDEKGNKHNEYVLDRERQVFILQKKYGKGGNVKRVKEMNSNFGYDNPIYIHMNTAAPFFDLMTQEMYLE